MAGHNWLPFGSESSGCHFTVSCVWYCVQLRTFCHISGTDARRAMYVRCGSELVDWCANTTGDVCRMCRQAYLVNRQAYCCLLTSTALILPSWRRVKCSCVLCVPVNNVIICCVLSD
jgi:hypothetical protein